MSAPPFIAAKWFTPVPVGRRIDWIVLHDMEAPEKGGTAESCAAYFASGSGGRKASAHYCVDDNSVVQSVRDHDVAYGAAGANAHGLHIEHAGYADQGRDGWADAYSTAMLRDQSAVLVADLCAIYGIPARFVDGEGLKRGERGITTHAECSRAFKPGGHTDPGPDFPLGQYLAWVATAAGKPAPVPASDQEDDMPYTPEEIRLLAEAGATKAIQAYMANGQSRLNKRLDDLLHRLDKLEADIAAKG